MRHLTAMCCRSCNRRFLSRTHRGPSVSHGVGLLCFAPTDRGERLAGSFLPRELQRTDNAAVQSPGYDSLTWRGAAPVLSGFMGTAPFHPLDKLRLIRVGCNTPRLHTTLGWRRLFTLVLPLVCGLRTKMSHNPQHVPDRAHAPGVDGSPVSVRLPRPGDSQEALISLISTTTLDHSLMHKAPHFTEWAALYEPVPLYLPSLLAGYDAFSIHVTIATVSSQKYDHGMVLLGSPPAVLVSQLLYRSARSLPRLPHKVGQSCLYTTPYLLDH